MAKWKATAAPGCALIHRTDNVRLFTLLIHNTISIEYKQPSNYTCQEVYKKLIVITDRTEGSNDASLRTEGFRRRHNFCQVSHSA